MVIKRNKNRSWVTIFVINKCVRLSELYNIVNKQINIVTKPAKAGKHIYVYILVLGLFTCTVI